MSEDELSEDELRDAIDGLFAYDEGATDSGIHDEVLRERAIQQIRSMAPDARRVLLSRIVRDLYLSDRQIEAGYGWEDAGSLCQWIDDNIGVG